MSSRRPDRPTRVVLVPAGVVAAGVLLGACAGNGIDPTPISVTIGRAFTQLYVLQQQEMGNPTPNPATMHTHATCVKGTPDQAQSGAGADWTCDVTFLVAGPATPVTAVYTLTVQTDGCFAADGDGPASLNGSRTITGSGYRQVHNPLWLIDACFSPR